MGILFQSSSEFKLEMDSRRSMRKRNIFQSSSEFKLTNFNILALGKDFQSSSEFKRTLLSNKK